MRAMIIRITDPLDAFASISETFLESRYDVISRSGLHPTETHLIKALPLSPAPASLLVLGNRTGVLGMIASRVHPELKVIASSLDLYHHHAIERNLARNPFTSVTARCEPDIPERDHFDAVCLQISKGSLSDELILDQLQQAHQALKRGGACLVTAEEKIPWLMEHMKKSFGTCSLRGSDQTSTLLISRKKQDLKKTRDYRAEFTMTIPNGRGALLATRPGVFAHRRVDEGAQELAETAATLPGDIILDLGCGCGSVGISLAVNQPSAEVVFIDSHSRATAITEENCKANGLTRFRVILSDEGLSDENRFTLFVGNPPYYSHDKISDFFIRTAFQTLKPGGRAYIVAKNATRNAELMQSLFGNAEILHRRGYQITKSIKR
jgi:16S rRNA (guanine1207-N2)-methyltransferase